MDAISSRVEGKLGVEYAFNGKELAEDLELDWYEYGLRNNYDPQIARFMSHDPLTDEFPWWTPYQFAGCEPIANSDLDGAEPKNEVKPTIPKVGADGTSPSLINGFYDSTVPGRELEMATVSAIRPKPELPLTYQNFLMAQKMQQVNLSIPKFEYGTGDNWLARAGKFLGNVGINIVNDATHAVQAYSNPTISMVEGQTAGIQLQNYVSTHSLSQMYGDERQWIRNPHTWEGFASTAITMKALPGPKSKVLSLEIAMEKWSGSSMNVSGLRWISGGGDAPVSLGAGRIKVKQWLQNVGNLEREQLIQDIESVGFKRVGFVSTPYFRQLLTR
jgi:RHS repeat-associated protein